ncbi:MAG: pstA [Thermoleophilia bacterium]|nr:pstA [Thermoleophilia bacterium]
MTDPIESLVRGGTITRGRRTRNHVATLWMVGSMLLALIPLVLVLSYVISKGVAFVSWDFLTQAEPFGFNERGGGFWNGIKGTIKMMALASVIAIPIGVASAVWLVEFGRGWFAGTVRFVVDVMTGVPSVFVGVFVYSFVVLNTGHFSTWSGSVALALLMLPIIVKGCESVLLLVPDHLREASLALGVPRWRSVLGVVLPTAAPGLVTAIMLAVARAAGETAPLLFTTFGSRVVTGWTSFNGPDSALPLLIYRGARSAYAPAQERAWAGALVLIAMILILTIAARLITVRKGKVQA